MTADQGVLGLQESFPQFQFSEVRRLTEEGPVLLRIGMPLVNPEAETLTTIEMVKQNVAVRYAEPNFIATTSVGADQPPYEGCERLGYNRVPFMEPELQAKIDAARASGRAIVPKSTGRVMNQGTRSETVEAVYWSCPPQYAKFEEPDQAVEPTVESSKLPIAPVVGGLVVAGLFAYLIFK